MRHPLVLVLRVLRYAAFIVGMRLTVSAQTFPSTTSIAANTPSLVLPATLTLTSIINQPSLPGGVATGNVSFSSDGKLLGTGPLTRLTATQSFPGTPTTSFTSGTNPAGIVAVDLLGNGKPALVIGNNFSGGASVSVYPNMGAGQFAVPGTLTGQLPSGLTIDAMATGNFLSTTSKSALIHQQGTFDQGFYNVVSVNASGPQLVFTQSLSGLFSQADSEVIAIDDFDGDGYSDVGVILMGENGGFPQVGIAFNQGASGVAGEFDNLVLAPLPSPPPNSGSAGFCADAITTGKFNATPNAQLAVLGHFALSCAVAPPALTPSYLTLYTFTPSPPAILGEVAKRGTLSRSRNTVTHPGILHPLLLTGSATTIQLGTDQTTIAAADFNGDGKLDLVVGSALNSQVQIYDGNGDGTFAATPAATASTIGPPSAITSNDFNGDGFVDLAVTLSTGGPAILLNDGTGKLQAATQPLASVQPVGIATADFNGDGLGDLTFLESGTTADVLLSDEAAQATLTVTTPMLAAGSHMLAASYAGDTNFQASTSALLAETVSKTVPTITWPTPQDVTYPTTLTNAQLDATSDIAGGSFTYTFPASAGCSPSSVTEPAGSTAFTTNCAPLQGKQLITVLYNPVDTFDYESTVTAQVTLGVDLPTPKATVNVPPTAAPGDTPSIGLTLDSYPVAVTVTITLGFTDSSSNPASSNGSICLLNVPADDTTNSSTCPTTDTFTVGANTGGAVTPRMFSAGDVAGTVTITITLTAGAQNITPHSLIPQAVAIGPTVPQIQTATMDAQGPDGLQIVIVGSSSTREISSATFHFTAAAGKTLKTPDITIRNIPQFGQWFSSPGSAQYGSAFTYTQSFTLDQDADSVSGVSVVLQNGQGPSAAQAAQ